jgi:hypothetical protein
MYEKSEHHMQWSVTSLFCEPFDAASALSMLESIGFTEGEVAFFGVLGGSSPELFPILLGIGVPEEHIAYFSSLLEDGAVLLMVRTQQPHKQEAALAVLEQHGGIFPPLSTAAAQ